MTTSDLPPISTTLTDVTWSGRRQRSGTSSDVCSEQGWLAEHIAVPIAPAGRTLRHVQLDLARAEPVVVAKHGRPVIVVLSVEEYERLKGLETPDPAVARQTESTKARR